MACTVSATSPVIFLTGKSGRLLAQPEYGQIVTFSCGVQDVEIEDYFAPGAFTFAVGVNTCHSDHS